MMVLRLTSKLEKSSTVWKIISPCACEDTEDLNPLSLKRTLVDSLAGSTLLDSNTTIAKVPKFIFHALAEMDLVVNHNLYLCFLSL